MSLEEQYAQLSLEKSAIGEDWCGFVSTGFDNLREYRSLFAGAEQSAGESHSLQYILGNGQKIAIKTERDLVENEYFESIFSPPSFLLQVSAVICDLNKEEVVNLDDKKLLETLSNHWSLPAHAQAFIFGLLKCRFLFDQYVIKPEFAKDYKDDGCWLLQRLEKYHHKKGDKLKYI